MEKKTRSPAGGGSVMRKFRSAADHSHLIVKHLRPVSMHPVDLREEATASIRAIREEMTRVQQTFFSGAPPIRLCECRLRLEGYIDLVGDEAAVHTRDHLMLFCQVTSRFSAEPKEYCVLRTRGIRTTTDGRTRITFEGRPRVNMWTFGDFVPEALMIHFHLASKETVMTESVSGQEVRQSCVYPWIAQGISKLSDFANSSPSYQPVSLRHVDTLAVVGEVRLLSSLGIPTAKREFDAFCPPSDGALAVLAKDPLGVVKDFKSYEDQVDEMSIQLDRGTCLFPKGDVFCWKDMMRGHVSTLLGNMPLLLVMYMRSRTIVIPEEASRIMSTIIRLVMIVEGVTLDTFRHAVKHRFVTDACSNLILMMLSQVLRFIASMLIPVDDMRGESWTPCLAEPSLARGSTDCEEHSFVVHYTYKLLMASKDGELCIPLKEALDNYVIVHMIVLSRIGPPNDMSVATANEQGKESQSGLHVTCGLVSKYAYKRLTSAETADDDKWVGASACPFILIDGSASVQGSPSLPRRRPGFDECEVEHMRGVHEAVLGCHVRSECEQKFRYYGRVIALYEVDAPGGPRQFVPRSRHDDKSQWELGIEMHDLMNFTRIDPGTIGLLSVPPPSAVAVKVATDIGLQTNESTCLRHRRRNVNISARLKEFEELADDIVRKAQTFERVVAVPHCEGESALSIIQRISSALVHVKSKAQETGNSSYSRITGFLLRDTPIYVCDGLFPVYLVGYRISRPPKAKTTSKWMGERKSRAYSSAASCASVDSDTSSVSEPSVRGFERSFERHVALTAVAPTAVPKVVSSVAHAYALDATTSLYDAPVDWSSNGLGLRSSTQQLSLPPRSSKVISPPSLRGTMRS